MKNFILVGSLSILPLFSTFGSTSSMLSSTASTSRDKLDDFFTDLLMGRVENINKFILDNGININAKNSTGETLLHRITCSIRICGKNIKALKDVLSNEEINVNAKDRDGYTPLHYARSAEAVNALLSHKKIDINAKSSLGWTPLHVAIFHNYPETVSALLSDERIDVNVRDGVGVTPLLLAADGGKLEIVGMILQHMRIHSVPIDEKDLQGCIKYIQSKLNVVKSIPEA